MTEQKQKRAHRTAEQIVADLEARIASVKARAAAKEAKQTPDAKALLAAVRGLDKALETAQQQKNSKMALALERARVPLDEHMLAVGIPAPKRRERRTGRRKKTTNAA